MQINWYIRSDIMVIGDKIQNYKEEIIKDLQELIKIRSVKGQAVEGKPFGEEVNKALEYVLKRGEDFGFIAINVDGYAGHVEYGEGDELVGVLVHLDIVPEGTGWSYPPFGGEIHNGKIYGRGASDNKGPAIVALYSLKLLKDAGIVPKKKIRIIFGANEESGMDDMKYYFSKEPVPDLGFSPDANYPIINREKGILHLVMETNINKDNEGVDKDNELDNDLNNKLDNELNNELNNEINNEQKPVGCYHIQRLWGGEAVNMVPPECRATIPEEFLNPERLKTLKQCADSYNTTIGERLIEISFAKDKGTEILAKGKSAHGASPQEGSNAIYRMLDFLNFLGRDNYMNEILDFIYNKIGQETTGKSLGINLKDDESGELTLNLGKIEMNGTKGKVFLDIRYPVTYKAEDILPMIEENARKAGMTVKIISHSKPLYVPETHPLIISLITAYEKITGEKAELLSMGGGTYARALKNNGVAFGGAGNGAHQPDEHVSIEELMKHGRICTQAIYELACVCFIKLKLNI
jgi:succinyl-diaminopimelate desuccinylase